jgi:hypothetical protein
MNSIGVDLHKKLITVRVMDQDRKILARKTLSCDQPDQIVEFFRSTRIRQDDHPPAMVIQRGVRRTPGRIPTYLC